MKKAALPNGLKVLFKKEGGNSVVIEVMIKVGSNHEKEGERGISHFLEHILFEGTEKRPTNRHISNEIERIGGDFNAYTSNEKTCFYIKVLKKHFPIAVDVLADILQNPLFKEEDIQKEKNVVLKEIGAVNDDPRHYQWILLQKTLFQKHPCKYPTYGDEKVIRNLSRKKIVDFFEKYYIPNNMVVSIVGDVRNWKRQIEDKFNAGKGALPKHFSAREPPSKKNQEKKERKNLSSTHVIFGFKTAPRDHKDSYTLDVINGILGRGQSGRMFTEVRSKRGLAYDVGTQSFADASFGYFAVYASIDKKNLNLIKEIIMKELHDLNDVGEEDLKEAKTYLEGDYLLEIEDKQKVADQLLFWEQVKNADGVKKYLKNIKNVAARDVRRIAKKYFKNYALVVLEGK